MSIFTGHVRKFRDRLFFRHAERDLVGYLEQTTVRRRSLSGHSSHGEADLAELIRQRPDTARGDRPGQEHHHGRSHAGTEVRRNPLFRTPPQAKARAVSTGS